LDFKYKAVALYAVNLFYFIDEWMIKIKKAQFLYRAILAIKGNAFICQALY
jgi:hypothetical protein